MDYLAGALTSVVSKALQEAFEIVTETLRLIISHSCQRNPNDAVTCHRHYSVTGVSLKTRAI
jgi:hypothetical protein